MSELFSNASFLERLLSAFSALWSFWTVWLPLVLGTVFYETWMKYVHTKFIAEKETVLLEIRIPRDITKSPVAMEIFLNSLYQSSSGNFISVFLKGSVRPWFSLEIVSLGGNVKFFIWCQKSSKNSIEAQLYSQYPNIEIYEAEDYSLPVVYDQEAIGLNGAQLTLTKPDPYPIKTYVDYGLDRDPKEEFKIDPITPLIEFLGSLKPQEQGWVQILVQAHKTEKALEGRIFKKKEDWKKAAKDEIKKIVKDSIFAGGKDKDGNEIKTDYGRISSAEKDTILAIERSISKNAFDTMIRLIYVAPKDVFNSGGLGGIIGSLGSFNSLTLNGFKKGWGPTYDYAWQDFGKKKEHINKRKLLEAYKKRSFFNIPYKNFHGKPFVLTTEELATIFHFPGEVSKTPTFERILSKKSEAPANLPI